MMNRIVRTGALVLGSLTGAAAAAQSASNVTVFGLIDMGVGRMSSGQSTLTFLPQALVGRPDVWTVRSTTSSRLGFRGAEDLGGGIKASFVIEHRFAPDIGGFEPRDGARALASSIFWNAQAWVGLSSPWGEVRLGRQYVPAFWVALGADPWGYDYNLAGALGFTRGGNGVTTAYNAVTYQSPTVNGFSAQLMFAFGENDAAIVNPPSSGTPLAATFKGHATGVNLQYRSGPLWAGFGYNDAEQIGTTRKNRYWTSGIAYNFGVVRPILSISEGQNNLADNARTRTTVVGVTAPVGTGTLKAVIARFEAPPGLNFNAANAALPALTGGQDTTKLGIGYEYLLSKRTSVHADLGTAKTQGVSRSTGFEFGIKHVF